MKSYFIKSFLPPLMAIPLVFSCSNNVEDKTKQLGDSAFSATRITTHSTLPTKLENWSDFHNGNHIELATCIKNKGINAPVIHDQFTIHSPDGNAIQKTSDENGCIYWGLYKNFDFLTKEHYSPHTIKIEGTGKHKGVLTIPLAINPWKDTSNAVKDLRFDELASQYIQNQSLLSDEKHNLHIKSTKISYKNSAFQNLTSTAPVYTLSYDISLWPTYKRIGLNGELIEKNFKEGSFEAVLSLMEKIPSSDRYFNISTTKQKVIIKNGFLNTPVTFHLQPQHWPKGSSLLEMFIQLTPIDGPDSLGDFRGTVSMKNMLQNNHDVPSPFAPSFDYQLQTAQLRFDPKDHERDDFIFEIDGIKAEYGALQSEDYNKSSQKVLKSKLRLHLVSPFNEEIIKKTHFLITVQDPSGNSDTEDERVASIDSNGILESYILIRHNAYDCSQWLPYRVKIQAIDGQISGLEKERTILLNPWDKSNFFYDADRQSPPEQTTCTPPQVHIAEVTYSNEELDRDNFHLDKYLNLSIRKFYNINFKPLLKIVSSHQKEIPPKPITYGKFTLRLDLYSPKKAQVDYQNPDLNNFTYITSAEKDVTVEEGVINENMGLPFYIDETVVLSYKNIIAITLTPKDEPHLRPSTRFFPFYAQEVKKTDRTYPLNNYRLDGSTMKTLQHIRETGFKLPPGLLEKTFISPLSLFKTWLFGSQKSANNNNDSFLNLEELDEALSAVNEPPLTELTKDRLLHEPATLSNKTLKKLCPLFYKDQSLDGCMKNADEYIKRQANSHIVNIVSTKSIPMRNGRTITVPVGTYNEGINGALQVGNRFSNSAGIRSSNAFGNRTTHSTQRHFAWGVKTPGFIGGNTGSSYAEQDMDFDQSVHSHMATSFNFGYAEIKQNILSFNSLTLDFDAKVVPCFSLSPIKESHASELYICDEQPHYARMTERWYFIADMNKKNAQFIADPGKIGDSRGPRIIRGRFNFNYFWTRVIEKSSLSIHNATLYPRKKDYIEQHVLQIHKNESGLFDKANKHGYDFFPGLLTPTPE